VWAWVLAEGHSGPSLRRTRRAALALRLRNLSGERGRARGLWQWLECGRLQLVPTKTGRAIVVLIVHSWLLQGECTLPPGRPKGNCVLAVHLWLVQGYRRT
jgi:hypothetical protein